MENNKKFSSVNAGYDRTYLWMMFFQEGNERMVVRMIICAVIIFLAVIQDVKRYKIKNIFMATAFLVALVVNIVDLYISGSNMLTYITGAITGWFMTFVLYVAGAMGAGDSKLITVVGLLTGSRFVVSLIGISLVAGAVIGIIYVICKKSRVIEFNGKSRHAFHYSAAVAVAFIVVSVIAVCGY